MKVELAGHYGYRKLAITSLPTIGMMLVTSIYSIVDGFFISNFAGSTAFAAINLIWPVIAILSALGLMVGTGGSALVSKTLGEGDLQKANSIFSMLVRIILYAAIVITVLLELFMAPIVRVLGAEGELVEPTVLYGRIISLAMCGFLLQMVFQSFYMVAEKPQFGTRMSIVCGVINIVLDALFVAVFEWGIAGAAVATAIALVFGGFYPLWFFSSKRNKTHLRLLPDAKVDWPSVWKTCTNGLSEYVSNIAFNVIAVCYNLQLLRFYGENGVSAYGIIMYLGFVFGAVFIGYNICVSQLISYNYGAGNTDELKSLLRKSLFILGASGVAMTVLSELCAPYVARIFVSYDTQLCELATKATRIYMLSFILCGFNMFCSAWFTALNNGLVSAVAAYVRTLVFELASIFVLPLLFGADAIWFSVNVAEILTLILTVSLILGFRNRYGY